MYFVYSGDIVTEIKMTVGQGDTRNSAESGQDIIRVPPPVDISSAPSHALAGKSKYKLKMTWSPTFTFPYEYEMYLFSIL